MPIDPMGLSDLIRVPLRRPVAPLLAALACSLGLAPTLTAQGVVRKEAQAYAFLVERRQELAQMWPDLDRETRDQVAARLVGPDRGMPFVPVLESLALARGCEPDPAFLLRGSLGVFALPEVVDPHGANPVCRDLHVTVFAPSPIVDPPPEIVLHVGLWGRPEGDADAEPSELWRGTITEGASFAELMRYQGRIAIPGAELADGDYTLRVAALLDGEPPRPHDPELAVAVHVCRGYQARAEAVLAAEVNTPGWAGIRRQVERVYFGRGASPMSHAVRELEAAERVIETIAGMPADADHGEVLRRIAGEWQRTAGSWLPLAVPGTGEDPLTVRIGPGDAGPAVVFWSGAPTYRPTGRRPNGPRTTDPGWLSGFLAAHKEPFAGWRCAVVESTGKRAANGQQLTATLDLLATLWGSEQVLLVAEREAAVISGYALGTLRPRLTGWIAVGGGALHRPQLEAIGDLPVRMLGEHGTPGNANLAAFERLLAGEYGPLPEALDVVVVDGDAPWSIGLQAELRKVAALAKDLR